MVKSGILHLLYITPVFLFVILLHQGNAESAEEASSKTTYQIKTRLGLGQGLESNVFFSETHPQSDTYTLFEAIISAVVKTTKKSLLFADFLGSYQHFWKFHQADRAFMDLALDYQYMITSDFDIGVSNTLSYANLKLFDTEGNTLPQDKFRSLSERIRVYGLLYYTKSFDLEMGSSYRLMDVAETEDQPPFNFQSLDFKEIGGDFSARYFFSPPLSTRLKYEFSVLSYDELQANNADTSFDGIVDPNNPKLRLRRQDFLASLKYKRKPQLDFEIIGKLRINDDRFEDDLTYRQGEVKGRIIIGNLVWVTPSFELSYKNRYYAVRRKEMGSNETLKEAFLIGNIGLARNLKEWLEIYLRYQWIHRTSNAPASGFDDHTVMLGLRLIR